MVSSSRGAAINPGNSGGALAGLAGRAVGIHRVRLSTVARETLYEMLGV